LLQEKAAVFAHNAETLAAKAQLEKSMGVSIKDLVDAKYTPPALKMVSTTVTGPKTVTDIDIRTLKGDVNKLSSFLDYPQRINAAQITQYLYL